jgi:hypothetical protein
MAVNKVIPMRKLITRPIKGLFHRLGYELVPTTPSTAASDYPVDFEAVEIDEYVSVAPYTMAGPERTVSLIRAVRYLVQNNIAGDIVECGVWKGGSMMAVARTLLNLKQNRRLWLYDTYEGFSPPTKEDISTCGFSAQKDFESNYYRVSIESVRQAVLSTGYSPALVNFVKGKVEETIPSQVPDQIALLRLDTDWYESTKHELEHLFPRLARGGVLIVDDYGHWKGARKATDEYFETKKIPMLLNRIDFSARFGVKM